jgi:hypothetical protein
MSTVGQISNGESGLSVRTKLNLVIDRTTVFDTAANFTSNNPTLNTGQLGIETDDLLTVPKFKIGDGANDWNTLPYFSSGGGSQTLQNVVDLDSHLSGTIYSPDNNTTISIGNYNLGLSTDGFLNLDGNIVNINGVQAATLNDIPSLAGYEQTSNKSSSYTASSTTTYANTKALVDGLATKPDKAASNIFMYRNFK